MQDDRLTEIAARLAAATPGPWAHDGPGGTVNAEDEEPYRSYIFGDGTIIADYPRAGNNNDDANAAFIAHAPADIAWLLRVATAARYFADPGCSLGHSGVRFPSSCDRCGAEEATAVDALRAALESR